MPPHAMDASLALMSSVPLIPAYAPLPESGTIGIRPATVPSAEQVVGSTGRLCSFVPTLGDVNRELAFR